MSMDSSPLLIKMHAADNVAVVISPNGLAAGTRLYEHMILLEKIPQGHKVALQDLAAGDSIVRYNTTIGFATEAIPAGSWVNEKRMQMPPAPDLENLPLATIPDPALDPLEGYTFEGFRNSDGTVGTRNILAITTTVQCVSGVVGYAVRRIKEELLPQYPQVDDVISLDHSYGCGVAIDAPDAIVPIRTLRNISQNPNFGGEVMVVSLGCEKLQPERLMMSEPLRILEPGEGGGTAQRNLPEVLRLQDPAHDGFMSMIESIINSARTHLERLNRRRRETVPAAELVVGVQCGGSDTFSGITANPAVGFATDLLVRAGATVIFSEVTEVRDGIAQLTARAANETVARDIIQEMNWYDQYLKKGQVDRSANTTPGNKAGGLSNIVEKAMGSIVKSGSTAIRAVLPPGERLKGQRGLIYAATPASDFICGTLQLAAGMNLHVFTTGRGTPYGLAEVPVIKMATRTELAERWHDLIDIDAGPIASGQAGIEDIGWELFHYLLDVASGRKRTWAEKWQLHNDLTLFNPAPVT
jgi:galactarate dehydratase